jgi:hypothetical protein
MFAKISLTAAFLLMVAPPMACASNRALTNSTPTMSHRAIERTGGGIVVAQASDSNAATSDDEKDNDNDNADDNNNDNDNENADQNQADNGQNGDNQMDQNQEGADSQTIPPTVLGQPDAGENDSGNTLQAPQFGQPMNPYQ